MSSFPAGETDRTPSPSVSHPTGSESRLRVDIIPAVEFGTKPSWGLFAAIGTGTIGGYVCFRSNFVSARGSYTIDSGGAISTGATLTWKHLCLLAGIRYQSGFSFLAGAGISF